MSNDQQSSELDDPHLVEWVHNLGLSIADKEILAHGKMLTANHIAAVNKLLKKMFPSQNGLQDTHYLAEKAKWKSNPDNLVQIIYIDPGHWACLSNKFSDCAERIELFDSMYTIPSKDGNIIKQVCCVLQSKHPSVTVDVIGVQLQFGGIDCGLFAISMAFDLCSGVDPFTQEVIQDAMRHHLVQCFECEEMSSFPKSICKSVDRKTRVLESVSVPIFCICRQVEYGNMARCDRCGEWFHQGCIVIPSDIFENASLVWNCVQCEYLYLHV